jgi:branched-subunit amino acid transport protein
VDATVAIIVVLAVGAATYAMRASAIVLFATRAMPAALERSLRNVGPAVLAALTVNLAAGSSSGGAPSVSVAEVAALLVAGLAAWWRKNLLVSLAAGMVALWLGLAVGG